MDHLWAPWRMAYIAAPKPVAPPTDGPADCFLCRGLGEIRDEENLILLRTELSTVVLNKFPYNNGHLLIAPLRHVAKLDELSDAESLDLQKNLQRMLKILESTMKPEGFNVGLNLGKVAGAGLPGHLHWHIVPRWNGDTNFMPVFTDTRVIVQSLDSLYKLLKQHL